MVQPALVRSIHNHVVGKLGMRWELCARGELAKLRMVRGVSVGEGRGIQENITIPTALPKPTFASVPMIVPSPTRAA